LQASKPGLYGIVIDDFLPLLTLSVSWLKNADLGNTIKPKHAQDTPTIELYDEITSSLHSDCCKSNMTYGVTLTDPDAPSRDNPEWSEICHWIAAGVPLPSDSAAIAHFRGFSTEGDEKL
jgi:phosphatidylethanolamine-binding protein (PEBP) family uncharacterized protein